MTDNLRCTGWNDAGYWMGRDFICPTEPDYIEGKGIWWDALTRCQLVADASGLCPRHAALAALQEVTPAAMCEADWKALHSRLRRGAA